MTEGKITVADSITQIGIRLIGFALVLIFVVLAIKMSWFCLFGAFLFAPLLFTKAGYEFNWREGHLEKYLRIFPFAHTKRVYLNSSFTLHFDKGEFLKPIFQSFSFRGINPRVEIYSLTIVSREEHVSIELPLEEDEQEARQLAEKISSALRIELSINF